MTPTEKIKLLQPGNVFYGYEDVKTHVVNIFQDGEETIITYKQWIKRWKCYVYTSDRLSRMMSDPYIRPTKQRKK